MKNVLWARIGGRQNAFSYAASQIEMRRGTTQGPVLETFSNQTPLSLVKQTFERL
jgi:hypothetical protein